MARRKRRRNPQGRKITSRRQFRALAAKMTRGEISKRDFDDMVLASRPYRRLPEKAPSRKRHRTRNFASGMRNIRNLPPGPRVTRWFAENNPARRGQVRVTKDQRDLLNWMNRNGGISDGKITVQTPAVRRALESLRKRGLVRKKGTTGKNARYTVTTKGFHALGKTRGVRVKRVSRKRKTRRTRR